MSTGNSKDVTPFILLPHESYRTMVIAGAREFRGPNIEPKTQERSRIVDLIYEDVETGANVHQNYSIDRPSYLFEVLMAITNNDEEQANWLLDNIDWEDPKDVESVMGIEVKVYVTNEKYAGRLRNRIHGVEALNTGGSNVESAF